MNREKLQACHLERLAVIYPRQSTLKQLHDHKESTARQYALQERAREFGWAENKVIVVEDDMGQSGASSDWRPGFQRIAEDVAHGRVGAIFALEVSRLARSSADWHKLLELCALADVAIIDEQAVYNPCDYNDRLLLGLKGTMSEAELYWMRLRLEGGRLSKARRGELSFCSPAGYDWNLTSLRFRFTADDAIRKAIMLVFERFRVEGSAYGVARYFGRMKMMLPSRDISTREITWISVRQGSVLRILRNPIYAGAYVFGKKEERMGLVDGKLRRRKIKKLPQEEWKCVIHDRHPAYITWDEYMANQKKIYENRAHHFYGEQRGAAREGRALLQGIILCGKCGRRMQVRYQGKSHRIQYYCMANKFSAGSLCSDVAGDAIDRAVEEKFLAAVIPAQIELAFAVTQETESQLEDIERQWQLKKERLTYEANLAARRYKATDPDNRVVARTLEREWEEKLQELEQAEREHQTVRKKERLVLTECDRDKILAAAKNLRSVWRGKTTTYAERKNLIRALIRDISLTPVDVPRRMTQIKIWWQTGAVTELMVERKSKFTAQATSESAVKIIENLYSTKDDAYIADKLNKKCIARKNDKPWDSQAVRVVRYTHGFNHLRTGRRRAKHQRSDGLYSKHGVAARLGVSPGVVNAWAISGILPTAEGGGTTKARWFKLDEQIISLLEKEKLKRLR